MVFPNAPTAVTEAARHKNLLMVRWLLANENLLLKAAEMGIGTLVMGIRDEKKLHEILSIPEEQMVVSVIGVGYGTVSPDMPKRKSVEDVAVIC